MIGGLISLIVWLLVVGIQVPCAWVYSLLCQVHRLVREKATLEFAEKLGPRPGNERIPLLLPEHAFEFGEGPLAPDGLILGPDLQGRRVLRKRHRGGRT